MSPAVSVLHTWRVGVERREERQEEAGPPLQVHPSQESSLHKHQSPLQADPSTHYIYHHPTDLFPTNPLHCPKNPQFLKILPDAQIHSEEERGREMPNQQPAFGTLV